MTTGLKKTYPLKVKWLIPCSSSEVSFLPVNINNLADTFPFVSLMSIIVRVMAFNATFNNISVISWRSVLLVEKIGVHRQNPPTLAASHWQTLSRNVVSSTSRLGELTALVVIGTDCIGSCKSTTIWSQPRRPLDSTMSEWDAIISYLSVQ